MLFRSEQPVFDESYHDDNFRARSRARRGADYPKDTFKTSREARLYPQKISRPEEITSFEQFYSYEDGRELLMYWIPTKYDIRRYVRTAKIAHIASGRSGPINILEVGGGSGFLAKLIADEAKDQGLNLEVTVIDPDEKLMRDAALVYADTKNLKFESGTAAGAVKKFGPKLTNALQKEFDDIDRAKKDLIVEAERVLNMLSGDDAKYFQQWDLYHQRIIALRRRQEKICEQAGVGTTKVDMVVNSWMPMQIDFTAELRMIGAPALVYAKEACTGCEDVFADPEDVGKEISYSTGDRYKEYGFWNTEMYSGQFSNSCVSEIQIRKDIVVYEGELDVIEPDEDEEYLWEQQ